MPVTTAADNIDTISRVRTAGSSKLARKKSAVESLAICQPNKTREAAHTAKTVMARSPATKVAALYQFRPLGHLKVGSPPIGARPFREELGSRGEALGEAARSRETPDGQANRSGLW
jgi:hypothetical protein